MLRPYRTLSFAILLLGLGSILNACGSSQAASGPESDSYSALRKKYARNLGVEGSSLERMDLYAEVDDWRGTPYSYGGQSKSGVDCSGFVGAVYRDVYDINLPREVEDIYEECDRHFRRKQRLEEGDLVFFDIKNGRKASHAGIYLKNERFVHASSSSGVVISKLSNPYYRKHFHRGGRID